MPSRRLVLEPRILFDGAGAVTALRNGGDGDAADHSLGAYAPAAETLGASKAAPAPITRENALPASGGESPAKKDKTVIIVDWRVKDWQSLLKGVDPKTVDVYHLSGKRDGAAQIADILANYDHSVDSLQILSHGSSGTLNLGNDVVHAGNIAAKAGFIASWGDAMTAKGDIQLLACNLAQGTGGRAFIAKIADLTGADVAASTDATGVGGDWALESKVGTIESRLALNAKGMASYGERLATYTVTSMASTGAGTLRQALADAAAAGGADTIVFAAGLNGQTIRLAAVLTVNDAAGVTIDNDANNDGVADVSVVISGDTDGNGTGDVRVLQVGNSVAGTVVTFKGITIEKGLTNAGASATNGGAARIDNGTATFLNSTFRDNVINVTGAGNAFGGAIVVGSSGNSPTVTFDGCTFLNNGATRTAGAGTSNGGAIAIIGAATNVTVKNTTFENNAAFSAGSAIYFAPTGAGTLAVENSLFTGTSGANAAIAQTAGTMTLTQDTFSGLSTSNQSVAVAISGTGNATVRHSTFHNNSSTFAGTARAVNMASSGTLTIANNIFANSALGQEVNRSAGTVTDNGYNILQKAVSGFVMSTKDITLASDGSALSSADIGLGALANNGGATKTHALLTGSVAINSGTPGLTAGSGGVPTKDAGGNIRIQSTAIDIGAYESASTAAPFVSPTLETASLTVTTTDDVSSAYDGKTSLREAIAYAATLAGANTVDFDAGMMGKTLILGSTLTLNDADGITIDGDIDNNGTVDITISGDANKSGTVDTGDVRVFTVSGGSATFDHLKIQAGRVSAGAGGGIKIDAGTVSVIGSIFDGNVSTASTGSTNPRGGAIHQAAGTLTITNSSFVNNQAFTSGSAGTGDALGGALNIEATATITGSTFENNAANAGSSNSSAEAMGGAIHVSATGNLTISNSTLSGNSATDTASTITALGGGLYNAGSLTATGVTLSGNKAATGGAGLHNAGTATLSHSTIAFNTGEGIRTSSGTLQLGNSLLGINSGVDIKVSGGTLTSLGFNLVQDSSGFVTATSDIVMAAGGLAITDAQVGLAALADTGGGIKTHALLNTSLAINSGSPGAVAGAGGVPTNDAAGHGRILSTALDIGAYESSFTNKATLPPVLETASLTVTTTEDVVNAYDGKTSLREAIGFAASVAGADVVTFDASLAGKTVIVESTLTLNDVDGITIDGDVDHDGTVDVTISGDANKNGLVDVGDVRIFKVSGGEATLDHVKLKGGRMSGGGGAAVKIDAGTVTLSGSVFEDNISIVTSGSNSARGGAVYGVSGTMLTITDCSFLNNQAIVSEAASGYARGGAVSSVGKVTITDSHFVGNKALAISSKGAATAQGGALHASADGASLGDGTMVVVNSTFTGNSVSTSIGSSGARGGAIYGTAGSVLTITDSVFTNNEATVTGTSPGIARGGAVAGVGKVVITDSRFIGNKALSTSSDGATTAQGGALHNSGDGDGADDGTMVVTNSVFKGNITGSTTGNTGARGGAIYGATGSELTVNASSFTNNQARAEGEASGTARGGAISMAGTALIRDSSFTGNKAIADSSNVAATAQGGALHNTGSSFEVTNSSVAGNQVLIGLATSTGKAYGGGIYNSGTAVLRGVAVADNRVRSNSGVTENGAFGGGAYNSSDGTLTLSGGSFTGNVAVAGHTKGAVVAAGGAISNSGTLTVSNTNFTGNRAETASANADSDAMGGALYNIGNADVYLGTFAQNKVVSSFAEAGSMGGAIYNRNSTGMLTVDSVTFSGNQSGDGGSVLYNGGMLADIRDSLMVGNYSETGTVLTQFYSKGTMLLSGTTISGNASGSGSTVVLSVSSGAAEIHSSTLYNNTTGSTVSSRRAIGMSGTSVSFTISNSIIANASLGYEIYRLERSSTAAPDDPVSTFNDKGYNILQRGVGASTTGPALVTAVTDYIGLAPHLTELGDFGGKVKTHALYADSIGIDVGNPDAVAGVDGIPLKDANGQNRIDGVINIGAVEWVQSLPELPQVDPTPAVSDPVLASMNREKLMGASGVTSQANRSLEDALRLGEIERDFGQLPTQPLDTALTRIFQDAWADNFIDDLPDGHKALPFASATLRAAENGGSLTGWANEPAEEGLTPPAAAGEFDAIEQALAALQGDWMPVESVGGFSAQTAAAVAARGAVVDQALAALLGEGRAA
ncbi:DUF4347 domain-containing protein [Lacibacterium aquatile]|uniref:Probable pectate lyase C n=1 Tax=Lacibacterium aquatile TaxID=1168082 RepID=A0ABW5DUL3_9PROT